MLSRRPSNHPRNAAPRKSITKPHTNKTGSTQAQKDVPFGSMRLPISRRTPGLCSANAEQWHPVFHRASVGNELFRDLARDFRLDLVHQLHCLDETQNLPLTDGVPDLHKR